MALSGQKKIKVSSALRLRIVKYCAITGDLIKSREIQQRNKVQMKLTKILDKVNKQFHSVVVANFSITLGDEFQGLIKSLEESYNITKFITRLLYPVQVSFGVGEGAIYTSIEDTTSKMDGECFFRSREALEKAKDMGKSLIYATGDEKRDTAVNTILMLMDTIRQNWKDLHWRRVWKFEELRTYKAVAKVEKVSFQKIYKSLKVAKYEKIRLAEESIALLLSVHPQRGENYKFTPRGVKITNSPLKR